MAGYADDFSKSNNAIAAENSGRYPASVLAKRIGVKPGAIRALLSPCEWHHTSKMYNATDYYDEDSALEIIADLKAWKEPAKDEREFENCTGTYLEWHGTRNHPRAVEVKFGPCQVTAKGKWFILHLPNGPVRKGKDTRGFILSDKDGKYLAWNC